MKVINQLFMFLKCLVLFFFFSCYVDILIAILYNDIEIYERGCRRMTKEIVKVEGTKLNVGNAFSDNLVADWLAFNADKSPMTIKAYSRAIGNFIAWLADNGIKNPARQDVINYREKLCSTMKVSTARLYTTAVKIFSKWLSTTGLYPDFAAGVATPKLDEEGEGHTREALTLSEARSVLGADYKGNDIKAMRDKLIMRLMLNCGLRSVEVTRLDSTDFEKRSGKIFLKVWGKARKGKVQRVQISKNVYMMIQDYLKARGAKFTKGEPLFTSTANRNRGERLQTQSISRLAKRTFRAVGIDSSTITCHSCRHFAINQMFLQGTVDDEAIRIFARHKSAEVTRIYRHDQTRYNNPCSQILSDLLDNIA